MSYSVSELIEMARALSEGDFDRKFQQLFQGELGELASYLDAVRQTLQSRSSTTGMSCSIFPDAVDGVATIRQESETGFNSLWEMVEIMQDDQAAVRSILARGDHLCSDEVARLREIAHEGPANVAESNELPDIPGRPAPAARKLQGLIESLEVKTLDLPAKFNVSSNKKLIEEGGATRLTERGDLDQKLVDQLLENLR